MAVTWKRRCAISAFDELHQRGFGPECLELTHSLMRQEYRRFPALKRQGEDLDDLVQDFLTDRYEPLMVSLTAQAGDEGSLARLLRRSIRNWLIDQVRKTATGAVRRSLEGVLAGDPIFELVPKGEAGAGRWRIAATPGAPWAGRLDDLVAVAWAIPHVKVPQWSSDTRRSPVADRASLIAIARAVLEAAAGSLETGQLVAVFIQRFRAVLEPVIVPVVDDNEAAALRTEDSTPEQQVIADDDELAAAVRAAEIIGALSPRERVIVPYLATPTAVGAVLGCGRSQAYQHAARLKAKIVDLAGRADDAHAVVLEVIRLCGGPAEEE